MYPCVTPGFVYLSIYTVFSFETRNRICTYVIVATSFSQSKIKLSTVSTSIVEGNVPAVHSFAPSNISKRTLSHLVYLLM